MKQLIWKLIIPLTIISFVIFTKLWNVEIFDGSNETLTGFPVPYMCPGWHSSLSLQIFVSGFLIDILTYLTFWFVLIFITNKYIKPIKLHKTLTIILIIVSGFLTVGMILIGINSDNVYTFSREFEIELIDSEYRFIW